MSYLVIVLGKPSENRISLRHMLCVFRQTVPSYQKHWVMWFQMFRKPVWIITRPYLAGFVTGQACWISALHNVNKWVILPIVLGKPLDIESSRVPFRRTAVEQTFEPQVWFTLADWSCMRTSDLSRWKRSWTQICIASFDSNPTELMSRV